MIQKDFKDAVFDIAKNISEAESVKYIILFGSVAKGNADNRSDIDICVVVDSKADRKRISESVLHMEKKHDKNIQLIITKNFERLDDYFIKQILTEGILIFGRTPLFSLKNIKSEENVIVKYSLINLSQSEKMKIRKALYGHSTKKVQRGKTYRSSSEGLIKHYGGMYLGRGAFMLPVKKSGNICSMLDDYGIKYQKIEILLPIKVLNV